MTAAPAPTGLVDRSRRVRSAVLLVVLSALMALMLAAIALGVVAAIAAGISSGSGP